MLGAFEFDTMVGEITLGRESMERIAIYYRVSTDKQDLESQKVAIDRWLAELPKNPRVFM